MNPYEAPQTVGDRAHKKPWLAFLLSFLLPGAGLVYLGKWKWGVLNLCIVLLIGFGFALLLSEEQFEKYFRMLQIGSAGGSAGLAQSLASQMNQKRKSEIKNSEGNML